MRRAPGCYALLIFCSGSWLPECVYFFLRNFRKGNLEGKRRMNPYRTKRTRKVSYQEVKGVEHFTEIINSAK